MALSSVTVWLTVISAQVRTFHSGRAQAHQLDDQPRRQGDAHKAQGAQQPGRADIAAHKAPHGLQKPPQRHLPEIVVRRELVEGVVRKISVEIGKPVREQAENERPQQAEGRVAPTLFFAYLHGPDHLYDKVDTIVSFAGKFVKPLGGSAKGDCLSGQIVL